MAKREKSRKVGKRFLFKFPRFIDIFFSCDQHRSRSQPVNGRRRRQRKEKKANVECLINQAVGEILLWLLIQVIGEYNVGGKQICSRWISGLKNKQQAGADKVPVASLAQEVQLKWSSQLANRSSRLSYFFVWNNKQTNCRFGRQERREDVGTYAWLSDGKNRLIRWWRFDVKLRTWQQPIKMFTNSERKKIAIHSLGRRFVKHVTGLASRRFICAALSPFPQFEFVY